MGLDEGRSTTLRSGVTTGDDNPVETRPFAVRVQCPARWDPSAERLSVTYSIADRNERIRRGRLRYSSAAVGDADTTLYTHVLNADQLEHGADQELPEDQCWDGTIREGIEDRNGERVTADLSAIGVTLEVWNTDEDEPAAPVDGGGGRTEREDEWLVVAGAATDIDAIQSGEWERNWVVPRFPEGHEDHDNGQVSIRVEVKNVRPDERVRAEVRRIDDPEEPAMDIFYRDDADPDSQPGLQELVVRDGRIVRSEDGSDPYVIFDNHEEHWAHPGNNFYAFFVGFGERGDPMAASERSAPEEGEEDRRLHMRFTVFIHGPDPGLRATARAIRRLHRFFRSETDYWRSYLLEGGPDNPEDWLNQYAWNYVVLFEGHARTVCWNRGSRYPVVTAVERVSTPVETDSDESEAEEAEAPAPWPLSSIPDDWDGHPMFMTEVDSAPRASLKDVPDRGFRPDRNVCPTDVTTDEVGGCGVKDWIIQQLCLGRGPDRRSVGDYRGKPQYFGNVSGETERTHLLSVVPGVELCAWEMTLRPGPRFVMFSDGCRTMLTTNLGEYFVENGTRYHHGWVYSAPDNLADFVVDLFEKWIKGTEENPAPSEFDADRFLTVYRSEARRTRNRRSYHPRMLEGETIHNQRAGFAPETRPGEALA